MLAYNSINLTSLSISFLSPFHNVLNMTWITPSLQNCMYPQCMCTHLIDPRSIYLLCCAYGNEHIRTHDAICNTFAIIVRDVGFHLRREQLHALLSKMFNSYRRIDIVFTKDDIHTFIDVVIVNPTRADLLPVSCATQRFVIFNVTQAKKQSYRNRHPVDQLLP